MRLQVLISQIKPILLRMFILVHQCVLICRLTIICYLTQNTKMTDFTQRMDEFRTTIMSIQSHSVDSSRMQFISPQKWKYLMLKSLRAVSQLSYADKDLIHDLKLVIVSISQDKFIQANLSFQSLKPKIRPAKFLDLDCCSSRMASTATISECCIQKPRTKLKRDQSIIQKGSIILKKKNSTKREPGTCQTLKSITVTHKKSFLKQYLEVINEDILKQQFQKKYHPFKKIINSFVFILENKYRNIVDQAPSFKLSSIQELMTHDILILEKLFSKISQPYQTVFHSQNPEQVRCFKSKMQSFIKDYIHSHKKINCAIRKVMRHFSRKSKQVLRIQHSIEDFIQIQRFQIPQDFKIGGCYIKSMNSLMQFAQTVCASQSLKQLQQFRRSIAQDVDSHYQSMNQLKQRQINAQVQIQIIRFVVCKLKGWIPEIFAQLKFLQVVYGDEQIAYKYDDASYIYAQLITVFDALDIQCFIQQTIQSQNNNNHYEHKDI